MKKLMFLTMMFGLMVAFSNSVFAQEGKVIGATGSKKLLPKVGSLVTFNVHQAASNEPAKGIQSGRKYFLLSIFAGADNKGQQLDIVIDMNPNQGLKPGVKTKGQIGNVGASLPEIMIGDKVSLKDNRGSATLTFSRNNKALGTITVNNIK